MARALPKTGATKGSTLLRRRSILPVYYIGTLQYLHYSLSFRQQKKKQLLLFSKLIIINDFKSKNLVQFNKKKFQETARRTVKKPVMHIIIEYSKSLFKSYKLVYFSCAEMFTSQQSIPVDFSYKLSDAFQQIFNFCYSKHIRMGSRGE